MLSRLSVGTYEVNELTRHSSGNARPRVSLAEQLWTDSGLKSGTDVQELISIKKKKKSAGG